MTTVERFWNKVDIGSREECWSWEAGVTRGDYGHFRVGDKIIYAHRYSFFLHNGFYPPVVMHTCDNPLCVNPCHLLAGTNALNIADRDAKGRHWNSKKTHCKYGHKFTEANTYIPPRGNRACRECQRQAEVKHKNILTTTTTTTNN